MNIDELTVGQAKDIAKLFGGNSGGQTSSIQVGKPYLIRSVTYHFIGRVVAITDTDLVLEGSSWLADSGRFSECLDTGEVKENEPIPGRHVIFRGGLIDACEWNHSVPVPKK